jgi:hypothetical protein
MTDELAGTPSRELGPDYILGPGACGTNQWLGSLTNHHDGTSTLGPDGNKVIARSLPLTSGPPVGKPTAANPCGKNAGEASSSD